MQMHQIRYFLALCQERSFTKAAKRSGVSQPSLTNAIAALEQELGGPLFQRRPKVILTALGQAVSPYFERIAESAHRAEETARDLAQACTTQPGGSLSSESASPHHPASMAP